MALRRLTSVAMPVTGAHDRAVRRPEPCRTRARRSSRNRGVQPTSTIGADQDLVADLRLLRASVSASAPALADVAAEVLPRGSLAARKRRIDRLGLTADDLREISFIWNSGSASRRASALSAIFCSDRDSREACRAQRAGGRT